MLDYGPDSKSVYDSLCEEYGNKNSSIHTSWIQCIEPDDKRKFPNFAVKDFKVDKVKLIIAAADQVLSMVNFEDLLAYYGTKSDQRNEASKHRM